MSWLRTDDDMLDHEKWRRALREGGDGALLMWWKFSSWCSRRLTDGRVPGDMVEELADIGDSKTRSRQLRALVEARLLAWHDPAEDSSEVRRGILEPAPRARRGGDELVVVGYLKRNPSRAKVEQELERKAKAQRDYELRKRTDASVTNQDSISVRHSRSDPENVPPRPIPSPPIPSQGDPPVGPPSGDAPDPDPPPKEAESEPPPSELPAVREVFATWQRVHGHATAKLDAKRTARIRRALKLFTPDQLAQAIRGALRDDWLMGRDPKSPRKYDGLETLLRDTAQIERLIALERAPPGSKRPSPNTTRVSSAKDDAMSYLLELSQTEVHQ